MGLEQAGVVELGRILLVDDDEAFRRSTAELLKRLGAEVVEANGPVAATVLLREAPFSLVLTDLQMPDGGGHEVLRRVREHQASTPVVILTGHGAISECVAAIRAGAANFLAKPFHGVELDRILRDAIGASRNGPRAKDTQGRSSRSASTVLGSSAQIRRVLGMVERVAPTDSTVLVTGETGTGKEVIARLMHGLSPRAGSPFVAVNCGAIPENLIESELFGHAKGAFTGAVEKRVGRFAQANGGTLLLDEIGDLSLPLQVKLLRVLQEREVTPVGDARPIALDVRVLAATHRDLNQKVLDGTFRQDLFFRLNVIELELPPLRERIEDLDALLAYFLDIESARQLRPLTLADDARAALAAYAWPGNIRELENTVQRLAVLSTDGILRATDLPSRVRAHGGTAPQASAPAVHDTETPVDLQAALDKVELQLIESTMVRAQGNKTLAAKLLGINRTTLLEKLRRHGRHTA